MAADRGNRRSSVGVSPFGSCALDRPARGGRRALPLPLGSPAFAEETDFRIARATTNRVGDCRLVFSRSPSPASRGRVDPYWGSHCRAVRDPAQLFAPLLAVAKSLRCETRGARVACCIWRCVCGVLSASAAMATTLCSPSVCLAELLHPMRPPQLTAGVERRDETERSHRNHFRAGGRSIRLRRVATTNRGIRPDWGGSCRGHELSGYPTNRRPSALRPGIRASRRRVSGDLRGRTRGVL